EVHDDAARADPEERASAADGAGDGRARVEARPRARASGSSRRRARLMRLVSFERGGAVGFGIAVGDGVVDLGARFAGRASSLKSLLEHSLVAEASRHENAAADFALADVRLLPTVPDPGKIICIGI